MYTLDMNAASEADNISNYLKDTGKYKGVFTRAEKLVSEGKGTQGIGFTFEDEQKRTTKFDLWTINAKGEQLPSFKQLMAMMAVLRIKNITPSNAVVEKYSYENKKTEKTNAEVFLDLMNKPIGLLLRNTEYKKMKDGVKTGETGWRLELYMVFNADTDLTASEMIAKKTLPEKLPAIIATLSDKPLKNRPALQQAQTQVSGGDIPDFDEIPF